MSSELHRSPAPPDRPRRRMPTPAKRWGFLVAATIAGVMLWVVHQLLDWGWPGFLTVDLTGDATDWSGFVHVARIIGIAATGIAMMANLVRLLMGPGDDA